MRVKWSKLVAFILNIKFCCCYESKNTCFKLAEKSTRNIITILKCSMYLAGKKNHVSHLVISFTIVLPLPLVPNMCLCFVELFICYTYIISAFSRSNQVAQIRLFAIVGLLINLRCRQTRFVC